MYLVSPPLLSSALHVASSDYEVNFEIIIKKTNEAKGGKRKGGERERGREREKKEKNTHVRESRLLRNAHTYYANGIY